MLNIKLASDSVNVGAEVYLVTPAVKLSKDNRVLTSKKKMNVRKGNIMEIKFSEFAMDETPGSGILLDIAVEEPDVPTACGTYCMFLHNIPVETVFATEEEAKAELEAKENG